MRICKPLAIAATVFTLATAATAASAAPAPGASNVSQADSPILTVQTIAGTSYRLPSPEAAALAGTYPLSNGEVMRVSYEQRRLFAQLGAFKSELVPAGGASYAAPGTGMLLTFDQIPFATDVTVSGR